jgi:hypothetical protein
MTLSLVVVEEKLAPALPPPRVRHNMSDFTDVSKMSVLMWALVHQQVSGRERAQVAADGAATCRPRAVPRSLRANYEP